ncbi:MAG TPA: hypothetical protein VG186_17145 [Solirubrobacteraceae bacterium]|jgi:hypothetical protein|nr:hypothetical protein [Solirubrobacteraceae bacterium]
MKALTHRVEVRAAALVIATAAMATGCGGSSSASGSALSGYARDVKYSDCMRSHGIPGFPDPSKSAGGGGALIIRASPGSQFDPSSPAFASAQHACAKYSPKGGPGRAGGIPAQAKQQALRFSACMRTHGVPGFPDPVFSGNGIGLQLNPGSGASPASPAFKAAQKACGSPLPGGVVSSSGTVGNSR